jgi:hypothetical protein
MSRGGQTEIEATLALTLGNRTACFQKIASQHEYLHYWRTAFRRLTLRDRYYDLPGYKLAEAGVGLRLRRVESVQYTDDLVTLKGPARSRGRASLERLEIEKEWSPAALEEILAELPGLGVELPPISAPIPTDAEEALTAAGLGLIQDRTNRRLAAELRDGATPIAELALDHVIYEPRGVRVDHREIEIEAHCAEGVQCVEDLVSEFLRENRDSLRLWIWSKAMVGRALEHFADEGLLEPLLQGCEITVEGYREVDRQLLEWWGGL